MAQPRRPRNAGIQFGVELELSLRVRRRTPTAYWLLERGSLPTLNSDGAWYWHHDDVHLKEFSDSMTLNYDSSAAMYPPYRAKMISLVGRERPRNSYECWCLEEDGSIYTSRSPPWNIEITSPILRPHNWREVVNTFWSWLEHNYDVGTNLYCGTHVHVSKIDGAYTLQNLQRIAQAAIWWEPAWEAVLPAERRGNKFSKSLYVDNHFFAREDRSRMDAIITIGSTRGIPELLQLLQDPLDKYFGINFHHLNDDCGTVEFRRGSCCQSCGDVFKWISAGAGFILAAMKATRHEEFTENPPTVRGLENFILSGNQDFKEEDIKRLFKGKEHWPTDRPLVFKWDELDEVRRERIQRLTTNDVGQPDYTHTGNLRTTLRDPPRFPRTPHPRSDDSPRSGWTQQGDEGATLLFRRPA